MVREASTNAVVVVGGPQLSIYPEESLSWDCFDIAVVGDGEETLLEICGQIKVDRIGQMFWGRVFVCPMGLYKIGTPTVKRC